MVLQVLAHGRLVEHHIHAAVLEVGGGANAGQHQDVRGSERPGAQHHAAARAQDFAATAEADRHTGCAAVFDHDSFNQRAGAD
jgi:hypothetical protein